MILRNIYLYLVSFVTLLMMIFGIIFSVNNAVDLLMPVDYNYYYSELKPGTEVTEADKKTAEEARERQKTTERQRSIREIIQSVTVFGVALPVFAYHWRKIEREKQ